MISSAEESWMADGEALATLARIETNLGHLMRASGMQARDISAIRESAHEAKLANQAGFATLAGAAGITDERLRSHEEEDDRRFQELKASIADGIGGEPLTRNRKIAKAGGIAAGGGGLVLLLDWLLSRIGEALGRGGS